MYNSELKMQYIDDMEYRNVNLRIVMQRYFDRCQKMEEELQKDVSNFTVVEIIDFLKSLCLTSFETVLIINNQMKIYTDYCLNRNLVKDNQNHFYEITYDIIKNCTNTALVNEQIVTKDDLFFIINQLQNVSDKFLVLALFEGICGHTMCELIDLNMSDFNGNEVTLCTGRKLIVSDKLVSYAKQSTDTYDYVAFTKSGNFKVFQYDANDKNILKQLYNCRGNSADNKRQRLYNKLVRVRKSLEVNCISTGALNESGRINMIREIQKQTGEEDFKECLIKHKEVEAIYGKVFSYSTFMLKYGEIIERM